MTQEENRVKNKGISLEIVLKKSKKGIIKGKKKVYN